MSSARALRAWTQKSIKILEADFCRSSDTHLIPLRLPAFENVHLYLKDESSHPTGSLKHRLARSLFLHALCNGWVGPDRPIIEASSGSTAISEAYFARLLGLPFIAVMPKSTSREKIQQIEHYGGRCHLVEDPTKVCEESVRLAENLGGRFMDQFTYAERATDWRSNNNIAESIFEQMREEPHPEPTYIVVGAGTGGTSATLGRFARYTRRNTQICVADPDNSVFFDYFRTADASLTSATGSRIEGIGRARVEPSFIRDTVDLMVKVPDRLSLAALTYLEEALGRRVGASTGTNFCAVLSLALDMRRRGQGGSIVAILCDGGERYANTYYSQEWRAAHGFAGRDMERDIDRVRALATDPLAGADDMWLELTRKPGWTH